MAELSTMVIGAIIASYCPTDPLSGCPAVRLRQIPELHPVLHQQRHRDTRVSGIHVDIRRRRNLRYHLSHLAVVEYEQAGIGPAGDQQAAIGQKYHAILLPRPGPDRFDILVARRPRVDPLAEERHDHEPFTLRIPGDAVGALEFG